MRALCIICSLRTVNTFGVPVEPEVCTVIKGESLNQSARKRYKSNKKEEVLSPVALADKDINSFREYFLPSNIKLCSFISSCIIIKQQSTHTIISSTTNYLFLLQAAYLHYL